ncbi:hypothetical protein PIB30_059324 [Stylosanthes scabra]|uniref:Uncharacterized protein n=1 Tax=Stylosanthes scabra TaxID=79078 RepID=A0ABU6QJQ1_9FABA|nr:hypothetical protein [Stylosanthes scabra]
MAGGSKRQIEVQTEDQTPHKWCISLGEEVFKRFFSQANPTVHKVFGDGSFFSPMLFGKFFDPSDAFPLWEFESDVLLSHLRSNNQTTVDWSETDDGYIVKAEIPVVSEKQEELGKVTTFKCMLIMEKLWRLVDSGSSSRENHQNHHHHHMTGGVAIGGIMDL